LSIFKVINATIWGLNRERRNSISGVTNWNVVLSSDSLESRDSEDKEGRFHLNYFTFSLIKSLK
jgi:hypothetical protein